jgi:hypothetical protein
MKILLSSSIKHFNPVTKKVVIRHSVGVLVELFSQVLEEFGEITYIGDNDHLQGEEFDLIVSWPRNFSFLTTFNRYKKSVCFFNIAESNYLKFVLSQEANRLGCKVSDCFTPQDYYRADLNFLIGGEEVKAQYVRAGVDPNKIIPVYYRHGYIPWKSRPKNDKPVFLHIATSLGLRKGFWHVVEDFKKANLNAELVCIGQIQREKIWLDYAKEVTKDPRIKIIGWINNDDPAYVQFIHDSDFIVFPSFGEGQPGSVIEAMEGGCLPMTTRESGIPYYPLGVYNRGDTNIWKKAFDLNNEEFMQKQAEMKMYLDINYDNEKFKDTIRKEIKKLWV